MIREIEWTDHALTRRTRRRISAEQVEAAIKTEHAFGEENPGRGDWRLTVVRPDGRRFQVIYDHPVDGDESRACVVTLLRGRRSRRLGL